MKHGSGGSPGKGGRQMTPDEAELWQRLTHSLDKVKTKPRVTSHGAEAAAPAPPAAAPLDPADPSRAGRARASPPRVAPRPPAPRPPAAPPRPAEIDRRTLRQVAGGKVSIDATLDLHGLRQDAAHARLRAFLMSCQAKGHKMVLVVTGKGGRPLAADLRPYDKAGGEGSDPFGREGASSRGVLRRSVPLWLEEPELRAIVISYAAAGSRHGGDGALYIRLRKAREA
jgi:DNA-nicking Smr family endonuclease